MAPGSWLEFHPTDEHKPALRTEQEKSQPNRYSPRKSQAPHGFGTTCLTSILSGA
jgi:hypothetical protein